MYCEDVQSCFSEINAYCNGQPTGRALLVNTENFDTYQRIRDTLEADKTKTSACVSEFCPDEGLPDLEDIMNQVTGSGCNVLIGLSQAAMLRSADYIDQLMGILLEKPVRGHLIVLLDHCEQYLKKYFPVHPDIQKRVVLNTDIVSALPRIRVAPNEEECVGTSPILNMHLLLEFLERLTNDKVATNCEVSVVSKFSPALFGEAIYSVTACDSLYNGLRKKFSEIAAGTEESYGSDEQWKYLAEKLDAFGTISALAEKVFGSANTLQSFVGQAMTEEDENKSWLLWLSLKLLGAKGNKYLSLVLRSSESVKDFEEHIYMDLLNLKCDDVIFRRCYKERKMLIERLPENQTLVEKYCDRVGIFQKNAVFYLTDASDKERFAFMQCLACYDYSEEELLKITADNFPSLNSYLRRFEFNTTNTRVPDGEASLRDAFTEYFQRYKIQKITNRIHPDFMTLVDAYAESRPYNKLQARSSVVSKLDKGNAQLFFFDALGVEYLAYILDRCEKYGLVAEISIAQCILPSITSKNKEFIQFFPGGAFDIKDLDELKHHSQVYDYEQCKLPVYLFRELEIIDTGLKKIQSKLKQGRFEKAIIVSDHGASRLAVIHEQENGLLELDANGQHSGRCCPSENDPKIPFASYWDGYSILANYDRFKGSRRANVEAHGGASLEEVIVPIITLTKKPADIDIRFVNPVVMLKGKEPASITVFSNIPLHEPKLVVDGKVYSGQFGEDSRHAIFEMPELKRTKDMAADFYDGDKKLVSGMTFRVQKGTQEVSLFKKMPF